MNLILKKPYDYLIILLALLMTGCGPAKKNPIAAVLDTALSVPGVVLSVPEAILTANPNKIKNAVNDNYNRISGQCTARANYDTPECTSIREQQAKQSAADNLNAELTRLKAMPLQQLDDYYKKEIVKNPETKSKEIINLVKSRLIDENLRSGTFQGYLRASQVSGNPKYVLDNQNLARTVEDKKDLEQFTLLRTDDLNNFFDVDFKPKVGKAGTEHKEHMGIFALHSDEVRQDVSGILHISKSKNAPGQLSLGHYRLTIKITMHLPSRFVRQSRFLGNADTLEDYTESTSVTADVSPPTMSANVNTNFSVQTGRTKRGSMGGVEAREPRGEPTFVVDIVKAEVI